MLLGGDGGDLSLTRIFQTACLRSPDVDTPRDLALAGAITWTGWGTGSAPGFAPGTGIHLRQARNEPHQVRLPFVPVFANNDFSCVRTVAIETPWLAAIFSIVAPCASWIATRDSAGVRSKACATNAGSSGRAA